MGAADRASPTCCILPPPAAPRPGRPGNRARSIASSAIASAGERAVRVDILERLADLIRPLIAWREARRDGSRRAPSEATASPSSAMTSLLGCSGEDFASVLRSLGYRLERRPKPAEPVEPAPVEAVAPQPRSRRQQTRRPPLSKRTRRSLPTRTWPTLQPRLRWRRPKPSTQRTRRSRLRRLRLSWLQPKYRLRRRRCRPSPRRMRHPRPGQHRRWSSSALTPAEPAAAGAAAGAAEPALIEVWRPGSGGAAARRPNREHRERGRHARRDGAESRARADAGGCGRRPGGGRWSAGGAGRRPSCTHGRRPAGSPVAPSPPWRRAKIAGEQRFDRPRRDRDRPPPNAARHERQDRVPNAGRRRLIRIRLSPTSLRSRPSLRPMPRSAASV